MEKHIRDKMNLCRQLGGRPEELNNEDILCHGVDETKFHNAVRKNEGKDE